MIEVDLTLQVPENAQDSTGVTEFQWQSWFEQWLRILAPDLSPSQSYELSLVLTTDVEIQSLNATYRNHDAPTDVLAFACLENQQGPDVPEWAEEPTNLGDIIISVDTAICQAQEQGHDLNIELAWLACHGLLHLLGWDHPNAAQLSDMLTQQDQLMIGVGLVAPCWSAEDLGYV
jgi:probable rRNA maturation factor